MKKERNRDNETERQGTRSDFNATTEIFHKWCVQKREYML